MMGGILPTLQKLSRGGTSATASDLLFRPCESDDGEDCEAEMPDPVLRLAEVPAYLEDTPSQSADDLVVGALMGAPEYFG